MAKIDITPELVWHEKYNEDGTRREAARVSLPFQVIETVNESRATREEKKKPANLDIFDAYQAKEGDTFKEGWKNKLIWGDNLLVMGSLLAKFAGKIDLIYIDPPFATGADFSFNAQVGESGETVSKEQTIIEAKAYRDTWGRGMDSYITMMYDRLVLMRELLSDSGSIYVHCDWRVNSYLRMVLDEIFGKENFWNEVAWKRYAAHSLSDSGYDAIRDSIFLYSKDKPRTKFNIQYGPLSKQEISGRFPHLEKETDRNYQHAALEKSANASSRGEVRVIQGRKVTTNIGWIWAQETFDKRLQENPLLIHWTGTGRPRYKIYADEYPGYPLGDIWVDINYLAAGDGERVGYPTQKPEALLERIIKASSNEGSLIADFFCGSGTTAAVAEKLGRRWITSDLGRWAVHTTRKRLLGIENCKQFDVLNLGKYERQYWQGVTFGDDKNKNNTEKTLQYLAFILKLYGAHPIAGMTHLHGKKGKALVHIGAVDAPVTINQVNEAVNEVIQLKQKELHILGWEWEMGLNNLVIGDAKNKGVKLALFNIPREVMERQATDKGDVRFFELAYLNAEIKQSGKLSAQVELSDFVIADSDAIPEDARDKISTWSDYIDYWAVDWDFQGDTFMQGWVAYRTRRERALPLVSDEHDYATAGTYRVLVKVIDIFGNDTSQMLTVTVK